MELFVFSMFFILFSVVGCIIYLIYWPIKLYLFKNGILSRKLSKQINLIYIVILFICICSATYVGLYPDDDFYADEFKTVTLRDLPESAEFISKSADYPDIHGDYCSSAAIKLSKVDFKRLLNKTSIDSKMQKDSEIIYSTPFDFTLKDSGGKKIIHSFTRKTSNESYLFIGFCNDEQTVFINRCEL